MEAAGFAIGVVGLASLFNNVIDSFQYVTVAKSCGSNLQKYQLQLENSRLRLSRWGDALGLTGIDETTALPSRVWSEKDKHKAEENLGHILQSFDKAWEISKRYKKVDSTDLEIDDGLDLMTRSLLEKMQQLSIKRQNRARLRQKVRFALYDDKNLKELVDDIKNQTNELVELFPAQKSRQEELAAREVSDLSDTFRVLSSAATGQDDLLVSALAHIIKPANDLQMNFKNEKVNVQNQGKIDGGTHTMTVGSW